MPSQVLESYVSCVYWQRDSDQGRDSGTLKKKIDKKVTSQLFKLS